jgi:steroid delta-isomerase-like uncharacterized protein
MMGTYAATLEDNKAVVSRWTELWNSCDPEGVDDVFADDFYDEQLAGRCGGQVTLDTFRASLRALTDAMGHAHFEQHEMIAEGDSVMVRWTVRGVHQGPIWGIRATGKPLAIEGVNIFRVRDGRIVERRSFVDPAGVLGLLS